MENCRQMSEGWKTIHVISKTVKSNRNHNLVNSVMTHKEVKCGGLYIYMPCLAVTHQVAWIQKGHPCVVICNLITRRKGRGKGSAVTFSKIAPKYETKDWND